MASLGPIIATQLRSGNNYRCGALCIKPHCPFFGTDINNFGDSHADNYTAEISMNFDSYTNDGKFSWQDGNNIFLFDKDSSTPLWGYDAASASSDIETVDISSDGKYIVVGTDDENIYTFHIMAKV